MASGICQNLNVFFSNSVCDKIYITKNPPLLRVQFGGLRPVNAVVQASPPSIPRALLLAKLQLNCPLQFSSLSSPLFSQLLSAAHPLLAPFYPCAFAFPWPGGEAVSYRPEEEPREWSPPGKGEVHGCLLEDIFEEEVRGVSTSPCLSSAPGPPSMPAPSLATRCRSVGPVLSYRNRFDNWRDI